MACCYIAASTIAFVIRSCDALDINLNLQYNESAGGKLDDDNTSQPVSQKSPPCANESGISVISITGMTCAACVSAIESAVGEVKGVSQALVNLALQEARVFHDTGLNTHKIVTAIEDIGYGAKVGARSAKKKIETLKHAQELSMLRSALSGLGLYSTLILCLGTGFDMLGLAPLSLARHQLREAALFLITIYTVSLHGGWVLKQALHSAKSLRTSMHTLITASTAVGLALSVFNMCVHKPQRYYDSIVGILLIVTMGRYMDLLSRRQAAHTFVGLYSMLDETSTVRMARLDQKRVPSHIARPGDVIIIDPYCTIPCDAYVIEGTSHTNEAILTGESVPRNKTVGDLLLAGSRNGPGQLRALVHQDHKGSFLSQLVSSIESSLSSKSPAQQHVDTTIRYFVSLIFTVATISTAVVFRSELANGKLHAVEVAGEKMMTILAAACPCALGLATPCAIMAGIDIAWQKGIMMLEGGETIEKAQSITHVVLDKTGTLTTGFPSVTNMSISSSWQGRQQEMAVLLCAAEEDGVGGHPLATAVFRELLPRCGQEWEIFRNHGSKKNTATSTGRGVKCQVDVGDGCWRAVSVGSLGYMQSEGVEGLGPLHENMLTEGSVVFASIDGTLVASIILKDTVKGDAKHAIEAMKGLGIEVSMLTGDNISEARRIADELDIKLAGAGATPSMKHDHIRKLRVRGHRVMMVGDGMNDGPSLATADIGVMMAHGKKCMSSGGSVLILQSKLTSLISMLAICQSTKWQVSANLVWAICYNVVAVSLALGFGAPLGIKITPSIAAALMSVSSVLITLSGVLLRARLSSRLGQ